MIPVFISGAIGSFSLLGMFWRALGVLRWYHSYNSLLDVSELFLMYDYILFFTSCADCPVVYWVSVSHFLIKLCECSFFWNMYRSSVTNLLAYLGHNEWRGITLGCIYIYIILLMYINNKLTISWGCIISCPGPHVVCGLDMPGIYDPFPIPQDCCNDFLLI